MARRPTEDFIQHYDLLVSRTGNSPNAVRAALNRDGQLAASIRELDDIWQLVERHRRFSKRRFIVQAHPNLLLEEEAGPARSPPASLNEDQHETYAWEFDPDEHSAASEIAFAEQILRVESENGFNEEQY